MREIVHLQAGQCGNQIGAKVRIHFGLTIRSLKKAVSVTFGLGGQIHELT